MVTQVSDQDRRDQAKRKSECVNESLAKALVSAGMALAISGGLYQLLLRLVFCFGELCLSCAGCVGLHVHARVNWARRGDGAPSSSTPPPAVRRKNAAARAHIVSLPPRKKKKPFEKSGTRRRSARASTRAPR